MTDDPNKTENQNKSETSETMKDKVKKDSAKHGKAEETLSHAEQKSRIDDAITEAVNAGVPSAAEFKALWKLASIYYQSGYYKDAGSPAGCFVKIMFGRGMGLDSSQSMSSIDIVDGSPAMSAQLMAAKFEGEGGRIEIIERTSEVCRLRLSYQGKVQEHQWSEEDSKRAELSGKNNHRKYPRAMNYARAISEGVRVIAPGALLKAYTFGELTNERVQDMAGYLEMSDGVPDEVHAEVVTPQGSTSPPYKRPPQKEPGRKHESETDPTGIASQSKIDYVHTMLKQEAIPNELRVDINDWLRKHAGNWSVGATEKVIAKLDPFCIKDVKNANRCTDKQYGAIAKMNLSSKVPEDVKKIVADHLRADAMKEAVFTFPMATAWMECLLYYMKKKAPEPAGGDKDQNDEHSAYVEALERLKDELARRIAPNAEAQDAVESFIDGNTGDAVMVTTFINTVLSWEIKADA